MVRVGVLDDELAPSADLVLLEEVPNLRHQRRQVRVCLLREVAGDCERLRQVLEDVLGDGADAVVTVARQIGPQRADRREPQVAHHDVCAREQHDRRERCSARVLNTGRAVQPLLLQEIAVEGQEERREAGVVEQVAQVEHATLDAGEAAAGAERARHLGALVAQEARDGVRPERVEHAADDRGHQEGNDLVVGSAAHAQADRHIGRAEQQRSDVAAENGTPVHLAEHRHRDGEGEREGQRQCHKPHACHELAEHEVACPHRQREQDLERAHLLLLAPLTHGHGRDEEDEQERQRLEQGPHVRQVSDEELRVVEEVDEDDDQEERQKDERDRRQEIGAELLARRGHDATGVHAAFSGAPVAARAAWSDMS